MEAIEAYQYLLHPVFSGYDVYFVPGARTTIRGHYAMDSGPQLTIGEFATGRP